MKLSPKLLLPVPLVLAALVGASYCFLPTTYEVRQTIFVEATPAEIYPLLDNPTHWQEWSVLNKQTDPSMIHLYGGPMTGTGARLQWSGDKVGEGAMLVTESISPSSLAYKLHEKTSQESSLGFFSLVPVAGGTQVTWRVQAVAGQKPWERMRGAWRKQKQQAEIEKGLLGLKTLLQNNSKKKPAKTHTAYANQHP